MRVLVSIHIPVEAGNAAIKNGTLGATIQKFMETWKPEAAYFGPHDGMRHGFMVIDMTDSSQIPAIADVFFQAFDADVEIIPVMNAEDLKKGLAQIA